MKYPLELFFLLERLYTKNNLPSTVQTIKTTKEKITAVFIAEAFESFFAGNFCLERESVVFALSDGSIYWACLIIYRCQRIQTM